MWSDFLFNPNDLDASQAIWKKETRAYHVLDQTAHLIGWDPNVIKAGYIVYDEGIYELPYEWYFKTKEMSVDLSSIQTYYFKKDRIE